MASETFGEWLREQREAQGLGVRELGRIAGVPHATISLIENGKTGATRDMVRKLADGLGVPRADAVRAWLEDETQEGGAITYVTDPDTAEAMEFYEGISPQPTRQHAKNMLRELRDLNSTTRRETVIGGDAEAAGRDTEQAEEIQEET